MVITLGHAWRVPNENRKISMISLGMIEIQEILEKDRGHGHL